MYNPIRWIVKDINDSMRTDKVKKSIENKESVSLAEMYPLLTFLIILLIIIGVYKSLPFFQTLFNIISDVKL